MAARMRRLGGHRSRRCPCASRRRQPSPLGDGQAPETVADDSSVSCALASAIGAAAAADRDLASSRRRRLTSLEYYASRTSIPSSTEAGDAPAADSEATAKASAWTAAAAGSASASGTAP